MKTILGRYPEADTFEPLRVEAEREARREANARFCPLPPTKLPRFLYAPRREPREGMIDRHFYIWIDSLTGVEVEREDMEGFFEWCEGIIDSEARS